MLNFQAFATMIWIDYVISALILISAMIGLFRGFIREAFALVTWLAAIGVGLYYSRDLSPLLNNSVNYPSAQIAITFIGLFLVTLLLGGMISYILQHLIDKTGLTGTDRLLGMLFGIFRGAVLVAVTVMLTGLTPIPQQSWWTQSQLIPPVQSLAVWLKTHIPAEVAGYINFR
jgi:membrane protein required for colicin V production